MLDISTFWKLKTYFDNQFWHNSKFIESYKMEGPETQEVQQIQEEQE